MFSKTTTTLRFFSASRVLCRQRTAWRELLHPLPPKARQEQWMKRDAVEANEAILRQPYYRIFSYELSQKHATSPERLSALRAALQFPGVTGPLMTDPTATSSSSGSDVSFEDAAAKYETGTARYRNEYGNRLRPRYPESWDTVPPHQPSRHP